MKHSIGETESFKKENIELKKMVAELQKENSELKEKIKHFEIDNSNPTTFVHPTHGSNPPN